MFTQLLQNVVASCGSDRPYELYRSVWLGPVADPESFGGGGSGFKLG